MGPLDVFSFVVLAVLTAAAVYLAILLGALPGRIAARRGHPQVDAVRVAGWLGLLTLGLLWPLALIWAYLRPAAPSEARVADLTRRVERLEAARDVSREGGAPS